MNNSARGAQSQADSCMRLASRGLAAAVLEQANRTAR